MIKRYLTILILIILSFLPLNAQVNKQESGLKREVTLYNPYKPSLPEAKKRSFLPDMTDTTRVRPDFNYNVRTTPFLPEYTISPIKAAALLPDPLTRLYKSYVKAGIGNYLTPLAEISITNERSKKGAIGFYGRHFSTNGKVALDNNEKGFAGYMDNDASLFGKKFFRKSMLDASVDYSQKSRYAYGYDPDFTDYSPEKKDIRIPYSNIGGKISYSSTTLDSAEFSYDFDLSFDYFSSDSIYQRKFSVAGEMAKKFDNLYIGSGIEFTRYNNPDYLFTYSKYIASISPYLGKNSELWNFKLGIEALVDRNIDQDAIMHVYPDLNFSFNIVPSYMSFFAGINGRLERNEPMKIVSENPYLLPGGSLFKIPNTSHDMIITSGLRGNNGLGGNYLVSASYSMIDDMVFYSNLVSPVTDPDPERGNHFSTVLDDAKVFNLHGEVSGEISNKMSFTASANFFNYDLYEYKYAWNKPDWDALLGLKYNLRDKIIAGVDITFQGKRTNIVNAADINSIDFPADIVDMPILFNVNFGAEYRYSKILSFWTKINNLSNHYYEWTYYPAQRYLFMVGFTYSL
jgi:hypothetical protein